MKIYFYFKNIFLILLVTACSSSTKFTKENDQQPTPPKTVETANPSEETISYSNYSALKTETGTASYYAHKFHGKLTANGEIYDMYGLTAAHPTLPLGTIIKVTNLENDKNLVIRINDRMPKHPSRIVDLSLGTAKKLDMIHSGLAEVKIEILKIGDNKYKKQN